jgi:glycine oxidase
MAIDAVWTGFRPSSIDDAPILGATPVEGLVLATGHHRNGYLLAPVTAFAIEMLIADGALPAVAQPFVFGRFDGAGPAGGPAAAKRADVKSEYETGLPR